MATKTKEQRRSRGGNKKGGQNPVGENPGNDDGVDHEMPADCGGGETSVAEEPRAKVRTAPPEGLTINERVIRILRHGENIHSEQVMEALLELVESLPAQEDKVGAIVIAGRESRWAEFAGTKTPDTEYPEIVPDMQIDPEPSKELNARLLITTGKGQLENAKGGSLARIFWENAIEPSANRADRRNALAMVVGLIAKEKPELPQTRDDEVSGEEFNAIIFKHRRALEVLELCVEPDSFDKKSDMGKAVLSILEKIEDPRELAVIIGLILDKATNNHQLAGEIQKLAKRVLERGHHGMPSGVTFMDPDGPIDEDEAGSSRFFADLPPELAASLMGRGRRSPL